MLTRFKNKRVLMVLSVLLVLTLVAGGTYAWFVVTATGERGEVELGELGIAGSFEVGEDGYYYEPGAYAYLDDGVVKNTGTLALFAKVTLDPVTTLVRDWEGKPIADPDEYIKVYNDANIIATFDEDTLISRSLGPNRLIAWHRNKTNPNEYYVMLSAGVEDSGIEAMAYFSSAMGNQYMNAQVEFGAGWQATQYKEDAIRDLWGVDLENDLELVIATRSGAAGRMAVSNEEAALRAALNELIGRDIY